jgi:hypothetical protein
MIHVTLVLYAYRDELVADLPEWNGPIPAEGQHIFFPPNTPGESEHAGGIVRSVTWRMFDRSPSGFVPAVHPYVEIAISGRT